MFLIVILLEFRGNNIGQQRISTFYFDIFISCFYRKQYLKNLSIYFDILPSGSKNRSVVVYISDDASNKKLQFNKNSAENLDFCNTEVLVNQP